MKMVSMELGSICSRLRPISAVAPQSIRKRVGRAVDVIAGLQPPARAEGIAASHDREFHGVRLRMTSSRYICAGSVLLVCYAGNRRQDPASEIQALALGRLDTSSCQRRGSSALRPFDARRLHEIDGHQRRDVGDRIVVPGDEAPRCPAPHPGLQDLQRPRLVGLAPGGHLRHLQLRHGRMQVPERLRHAEQQAKLHAPVPHLHHGPFQRRPCRTAPARASSPRNSGRWPSSRQMAVPSSSTSTGTRWKRLSLVNSGVFSSPFMRSISSKGTAMPFSARKMRTRRGLGAPRVCRIFMHLALRAGRWRCQSRTGGMLPVQAARRWPCGNRSVPARRGSSAAQQRAIQPIDKREFRICRDCPAGLDVTHRSTPQALRRDCTCLPGTARETMQAPTTVRPPRADRARRIRGRRCRPICARSAPSSRTAPS